MQPNTSTNPLIVSVHIDVALTQSHSQTIGKLTWFYNGFSGSDLSIRVPAPYDGIRFELTPATQARFAFEGPVITRNRRAGDEYYPDLNGEFELGDDHVTITDLMINRNLAKVGSVQLKVKLQGGVDTSEYVYDLDTFLSDPEVTNTGQET